MTIEEAKKELVKIANGRYCTIQYYYNITNDITQCSIYIDGLDWYIAPAWEEAFKKLKIVDCKPSID